MHPQAQIHYTTLSIHTLSIHTLSIHTLSTPTQITTAYHHILTTNHPNLSPEPSSTPQELITNCHCCAAAICAYEVLSNPILRRIYDSTLPKSMFAFLSPPKVVSFSAYEVGNVKVNGDRVVPGGWVDDDNVGTLPLHQSQHLVNDVQSVSQCKFPESLVAFQDKVQATVEAVGYSVRVVRDYFSGCQVNCSYP